MKLLDDWKTILKKAWSIRLWALAAGFETLSMVLPIFVQSVSQTTFSILALIAASGGIWARLIEQKGVKN
jgi:hypothetical protein